MSKFKEGDKVKLEDGREGIVSLILSTCVGFRGSLFIKIGNKWETWHEDGLTKMDDPKLMHKVGDILYLEVKVIAVSKIYNLPYPYTVQPLCDHVELLVSKNDLLTKEDITNE